MSNDTTAPPITVYSPESPLRHPLRLVQQILTDLWKSRELVWILFLRDLKAAYRQSYLGYVWILLPPLMTAGLWIYLGGSGMVAVAETDIPRAAFVLLGTTLWTTFTSAFNAPLGGFAGGSSVFMKLKVPPEAFIASSLAKVVFDTLVRLLLLIPLFLMYPLAPGWYALLFPLALLATILFGTALGYWLIPIGGLYGDVARAVGVVMPVLMYTAPVVFPLTQMGADAAPPAIVAAADANSTSQAAAKMVTIEQDATLQKEVGTAPVDAAAAASAETKPKKLRQIASFIMHHNPVTPLIMAGRDWISKGYSPYWPGVLAISIISLPILLLGMVLLRVAMPHLVVRMGM